MADGYWKIIVECLGWFLEEVVERLRVGLSEFCRTEAYREYGYPGVGRWLTVAGGVRMGGRGVKDGEFPNLM